MKAFEIRRRTAARKRRSILAVFGALLVGVVTTTALMAGASTPAKAEYPDALISLAGDADKDDAKRLEKAAEALEKGLDEADAAKALGQDAKAVKELMKVDGVDVGDFIDALVGDAQAAADEAFIAAGDADLAKAQKHYDKALEKLAKSDFDKAIEEFAKAVEEAGKAAEKAAEAPAAAAIDFSNFNGEIPPLAGKFSVYDVTFVRADTVGDPNPVFLRVSGHNAPGTPGDTGSGNEGLIFSDEFALTDTFLGQAGVMQLHVSCSDAFPGGIGAKSDPQPGSQWLINTIQIAKVSDGEIEKECNVIGRGLPEPPEEPPVPIQYEV